MTPADGALDWMLAAKMDTEKEFANLVLGSLGAAMTLEHLPGALQSLTGWQVDIGIILNAICGIRCVISTL